MSDVGRTASQPPPVTSCVITARRKTQIVIDRDSNGALAAADR